MRKILIPTLTFLLLGGIIFNLSSCKKKLDPNFDYEADGLTITFKNTSDDDSESQLWTFGDGSTSEELNPVHVYKEQGTYDVVLRNILDDEYEEKKVTIVVESSFSSGKLEIYIKKKDSETPLNSNAGYVVIGRSLEEMYFTEYESKKLPGNEKQKPTMTVPSDFTNEEWFIDSAYTVPNYGKFPDTDQDAAAASFTNIPTGSYYVHVFDGGLNKAVGTIQVTGNGTDVYSFEVQPLGHLKVQTAQSPLAGSELDSVEFRLYGTNNDTFQQVAKTNVSEITIEPYFANRTTTRTNELGQPENGIYFLMDIPAGREYMVIAYSSLHAPEDGSQANDVVKVEKNILSKIRLNFR